MIEYKNPVDGWEKKDFEELRNGTIGNIDWVFLAHKVQEMIGREKPVEPIIKKSSGTWVARYDGIDYLCVDPDSVDESDIVKDFLYEITLPNSSYKPFTEIEITDEIAKLNPMVKCVNGKEVIGIPQKLIHVIDIQCFTLKEKPINPENYYSTDWMHIKKCKLATVGDLGD